MSIAASNGLIRALTASALKAGCPIEKLEDDFTRWASATFTGARHLLKFAAARSAALELWVAGIPEHALAIPGHLVADIAVVAFNGLADYVEIHVEALTLEERAAA